MRLYKKIAVILLFMTSGVAGFMVALNEQQRQENLRSNHHPLSLVSRIGHDMHAGRLIYEQFCSACHANKPSIQVNAPAIGNKKRWHALESLGNEQLVAITVQGIGIMPARGGCFECSDAQLQAAIHYMAH